MKRFILIAAFLAAGYLGNSLFGDAGAPAPAFDTPRTTAASGNTIAQAFEARRSNYQLEGSGTVTRLLADDNDGSRHQRFILSVGAGQTVLVAHNIDLAPRIQNLNVGDVVQFYGEYEWNERGGVIHWTHHDPQGRHPEGWLKHAGRTYQ